LRYDPQRDSYVQDIVRCQGEDFDARDEREEAAKRQKYEMLTTLKGLSKEDFRDMRLRLSYSLPRTASSPMFHHREEVLIRNEKYAHLKTKVAPRSVMCMEHLRDDYFVDAIYICKEFGLLPLMTFQ
jgi:hypothetical protein